MPQPFDFDGDPMEGYDTEVEESPVQPAPPPSPRPVAKPAVVAEALDELEDSPDPAELTEAEWRLEKAGFYRAVINSQLLSSDHPAAIEVEQELQEWATGKLHELLGIKTTPAPVTQVVKAELPFTKDQIDALSALADKVIEKQKGSPAPQAAVPAPSKPQPVAPATVKPAPKVRPVVPGPDLSMKRGRGRPRKPCRICGQLDCEHKRQKPVAAPAPEPQAAPPMKPRKLAASQVVGGETYDGIPIQTAPDGMKFIDAPNGRRYKLEVRTVTHKETGVQKEAYFPMEITVIKPPDPNAKPYPSEQEAMAMAAVEAQKNLGAVSSLTAVSAVGGKLTGKNLVEAAMAAPPKEEYIPEPPPGKKR